MRPGNIGDQLRAAREAAGLTIQDVAARTKIRADYLAALEENRYDALPERLFVRGYLQRYATELALDPKPLLDEFDRAVPQRPEIAQALRGQLPARRGPVVPIGLIAATISALGVVGALGWWGYSAWASRPVPAPTENAEVSVPLVQERQIRLSVESQPPGAKVYLDNRLLGLTPVRDFPLEARERGQLRIELDGHKAATTNVTLDRTRRVGVQLQPSDGDKPSVIVDATPARTARQDTPATGEPAGTTDDTTTGQVPSAEGPAPATPTPEPQKPREEATKPNPTPTEATPRPESASTVTLNFNGRSWVRVTDANGRVLFEGIPAVGSTRSFPAGVRVRAGSAGAVSVRVGDRPPAPLGGAGQVVERAY